MDKGTPSLASGGIPEPRTPARSPSVLQGQGTPNLPHLHEFHLDRQGGPKFPTLGRPRPPGWAWKPQVWRPGGGGSPNFARLDIRAPSCWATEPRISHACTNSIPTDRGTPNFMDLDDARPGERGEPLI